LAEEVEPLVKEAAEVSRGTEVSDEDIFNIQAKASQVVSLAVYRAQLFDYLKNRMNAIAPNLTVMVGELVGARLIAHAGSLLNLAKQPASTVQIIGAEKALFRALKTKHDTPKYGLIYHASLVGQAAPKLKGKISRVLAAKTALSIREDALGETDGVTIGYESREKVERRLAQLEGGNVSALSGTGKSTSTQEPYQKPTAVASYSSASDTPAPVVGTKRAREDDEETEEERKKKKKAKKAKKKAEAEAAAAAEAEAPKKKKKKKSKKQEE
jgi:nucleolar protein 58